MMRNRLIEAASEVKADQPLGREGLEAWCAQKNAWAARIGMDRWYRVRTFESAGVERHEVQALEGLSAREARAEAEGRPMQRYMPSPSDMARLAGFRRG